ESRARLHGLALPRAAERLRRASGDACRPRAERRNPAARAATRRRRRLAARRRTRGTAARDPRALRRARFDPSARWRRVAQRRDGRRDRTLRAGSARFDLESGRPPCGGRTKEFAEPVSLSSPSSNRLSASGLLPLRITARSWFRPTRAPCSAQGGTYANSVTGSRPKLNNFVAISAHHLRRAIHSLSRPAAGDGARVDPAVAREDCEAGVGEERVPACGLEPPQRHRRLALRAAHRERQRLLLEIPVGALVDPRLPLDPTAVRLLDVLAR